MSQCHVHAVPGSDVPCPCTIAPSAPPARELLSCPVPNPTSHTTPCLLTVNIPLLHCLSTMIPALEIIHTSAFSRGVITCVSFPCSISHLTPDVLTIPLLFPCRYSPPHFTLPSMTCVLKRFPLTSPPKLAPTCVKRGFLRTAEPH